MNEYSWGLVVKKRALAAVLAALLLSLPSYTPADAAGSTSPAFVIDANNPSTFTFSGSNVNSSVTESANSASGTANNLTLDTSAPTNSLVFGLSRYLNFSNTVKPDITNGISLQMVAYFTSSSYNSTWPRVLAFGSTTGWGTGNDEFSIQLSDIGLLQVYLNRSGASGTYTCATTSNPLILNAFAMYSIQVGSGGVCNIAVNGTSAATSNSEATSSFSTHIPNTSNTMNFRVGSMSNAVQSTLPSGRIRSVVLSSGSSSVNSVTFMENGGTGYMASQVGTTSAALSTNTYTRSGYYLSSWNTKSDGTGTSYAPGATYNFGSGSTMLFAQWAQLIPSLSLSGSSSAIFRSPTNLSLTINVSGKYTFLDSGKRISGCIGIDGTPPTVTCSWRPTKIGVYVISALGRVSGSNYTSNSTTVFVGKRSTTR